MIAFPHRFLLVPAALAALTLAGCGSQSSSGTKSTSTVPTITVPTAASSPGPAPTVPAPKMPKVTGSVAAIVNGHSIPLSTYRVFLDLAVRSGSSQPGFNLKTVSRQVMDEVIFNELIRSYAAAHHLSVTPAEITAQEKKDEAQAGSTAIFQQKLTQYGLTQQTYRDLVAPNLLATKVEQKVAPAKPARSDAAAHALAVSIFNQLKKGANFATLAHKYSEDPGSAAQGGALGTVYPGQTVPPFDQAAFHAPLHKYVIVHSQFGYHVLEVMSRGVGAPPGQANAKSGPTAQVRHILISTQPTGQQQQRTKFLAWLHNQQKNAKIKRVAQVAA